jgi:hypothetical protein
MEKWPAGNQQAVRWTVNKCRLEIHLYIYSSFAKKRDSVTRNVCQIGIQAHAWHLPEISDLWFFFSSKAPSSSSSDSYPEFFEHKFEFSENSKVILRIISIRWMKLFCHARTTYEVLFLFGFRSNSSPSIHFLKYCSVKAVRKNVSVRILKFLW